MRTYWMDNFGCRATQADAAAIEAQLAESGLSRSGSASAADLIVLNTCTVTAAADAQAREAIRRVHRENPAARVLATGCYAQRAPEELAALPGVAWVVGNSHQKWIGALCKNTGETPAVQDGRSGDNFVPLGALSGTQRGPARDAGAVRDSFVPLGVLAGARPMALADSPKILTGDIFEVEDVLVTRAAGSEGPSPPRRAGSVGAGRTRPVLKIQDGCNNRCAYCVIPFVRGRSRSLAPERVVQEVCALAAAGAREVVLSGINLGAYGRDLTPHVGLRDLLARLVDETPVERIRLSSIEPMDLTLDLVDLVARHSGQARSGRIAPHFHVPLQSGSDRMLAAMHRWYRAAHYAERILLAAERLPAAGIGADVICGFPGETGEDHRRTVELIERLPFSYLHVFSYSSRPGTRAAAMAEIVPDGVIRERARELRALSAKKAAAFRAAQNGALHRVLTLGRTGTDVRGQAWTTEGTAVPCPYEKRSRTGSDGEPWTAALTGNYVNVRVAGRWPRNTWLNVRLSAAGEVLRGEVIAGAIPA